MKTRICSLIGALLSLLCIAAPGDESVQFRNFDIVTISGVRLFLEAPVWKDSGLSKPPAPPSEGFIKLLHSRPQMLSFNGGNWYYSSADSLDPTQPKKVDTTVYKLGPNDLACTLEILKNPFIEEYVKCMREAYTGQGQKDCVLELLKAAIEAGKKANDERLTAYLNTRIGAQLLALSNTNPEWKSLLSDRTNKDVRLALEANSTLEEKKAAAASIGRSDGQALVSIASVDASEASVEWPDFLRGREGTPFYATKSNPVLGWKSVNGTMELTNLESNPSIYTVFIDKDKSLLISGPKSKDHLDVLYQCRTLSDVAKIAHSYKWKVYLSRSGSAQLGALQVEP